MKSTEFEKYLVINEIKSLYGDILEIYTSQKILHTKYYIHCTITVGLLFHPQ